MLWFTGSIQIPMAAPRFLKLMHRAGWEFWLPLPLIAVLFWVAGHCMTTQVLNRPYDSVNKLETDRPLNSEMPKTILGMNADIDRRRGATVVFVKTADSSLKKVKYTFTTTQTTEIESAIAQELKLPVGTIRKLISYRLIN